MSDDQNEERTEEPTEKRRREYREKGQVARSNEVNTAMLMTGALIFWSFYAPVFWRDLQSFLAIFWRTCSEITLTAQSSIQILIFVLLQMVDLIWPLLLGGFLIGFLAGFIQIGWLFTLQPLQPDFNKMDPIKGMGKLISKRSFFEAGKSIGKVVLVGVVAYQTLFGRFEKFMDLAGAPLGASVAVMAEVMFVILLKCCLLLTVIAVVDFLFSRREMEEKMKMTKQEVKEESKETEGDPQLKQKIRSIQRDMAKKRMMDDVPKSDVIITNPTHYAVAIRYRRAEMEAPVVVAKGTDHLARRIREVGEENNVPRVEKPAVARALYQVEIGEAIPEQMYKAVAEILAYVYGLKKNG
ncbi:MAG: flagellar biosynthesis protein FlhB [Thermodesulfobacteriota bacterium]